MWVRSWAWFFRGAEASLHPLKVARLGGILSVRPRLVAAWCYIVREVSEVSSGAGGVVLFLPGV